MIVIEDVNGLVYYINPDETHMTPNGSLITYEQVINWMYSGTLREHGFRAPTVKNEFNNREDNGRVARNAINSALLSAVI